MRKPLYLMVLLLGMTLSAFSFAGRTLPVNGQLGVLDHYQTHDVSIDGDARQPAAAIQVRGIDNRLLAPQQVPEDANIWYTTEPNGNVWKIWLLSDDELATIKKRLKDEKK